MTETVTSDLDFPTAPTAEGGVHERLAAVTRAVSHIAKERSDGVSYSFRSIDAVMKHLHVPLAEQGLTLSPRVLDDWQLNMIPGTNNRVQGQALFRVCIDVYAPDGSMTTIGPGLAQSHDYGDKAVYQAQQNAIKYLLLTAFSIPVDEPDMDGRPADDIPSAAKVEHDQLLAELETALAEAAAVGASGDPAKAREYASQSPAHARKALETVRTAIAEAPQKGTPVGDVEPEPETVPSDEELAELRERIRAKVEKHVLDAAMAGYLADQYDTNSLDDLDQPQLLEIASDLNAATGRKAIEAYGEAVTADA